MAVLLLPSAELPPLLPQAVSPRAPPPLTSPYTLTGVSNPSKVLADLCVSLLPSLSTYFPARPSVSPGFRSPDAFPPLPISVA